MGVGTTSPSMKLDVSGSGRFVNGSLTTYFGTYGIGPSVSQAVTGIAGTYTGQSIGLAGTGSNTSGYDAYGVKGTAYASGGGNGYGVHGTGSSAGGYFKDSNNTGETWIAQGDRGIWSKGSFAGATFLNTTNESSYWTDIATSDGYGVKTPRPVTASSFPVYSDIKLKRNVQPLLSSLDKILGLKGVSFEWQDDTKPGTYFGFIAQDVEEVVPELVSVADDYKVVNYDGIIPLLSNAIKELKTENDALKSALCDLSPEADICHQ